MRKLISMLPITTFLVLAVGVFLNPYDVIGPGVDIVKSVML